LPVTPDTDTMTAGLPQDAAHTMLSTRVILDR